MTPPTGLNNPMFRCFGTRPLVMRSGSRSSTATLDRFPVVIPVTDSGALNGTTLRPLWLPPQDPISSCRMTYGVRSKALHLPGENSGMQCYSAEVSLLTACM